MTWAPVIGSLLLRPERAPLADDERALLADVIATPEADGPRLVYADWLQHHGDTARGELIAVQCALATIEDPIEHNRLKARDFELVERHGNRWCAEVGIGDVRNNWHGHVWAADFQRGFVELVRVPAAAFPSVVTKLLAFEPVRAVALRGWHDNRLRRLGESIYLRRLRALAIEYVHLDDDTLAPIVASPMLGALERLAIDGQVIGARTLDALGASSVRQLSLCEADLGDDQLLALLASPVALGLEVLELRGNPFGNAGALGLVRSVGLQRLRRLSLADVELDAAVREQLVERFGAALQL